MKTSIQSPLSPPVVGPYSHGIISGNMIFTAGQIHVTSDGKILEGTIQEQTHQVMKNLQAVLEAASVSFENVVKTTIYLVDMADYAKVNEVYASYLQELYPARETVCVSALPANARLEISMIAMR